MSSNSVSATYVQWGWRIPFLIGGAGTFWFAWFYAKTVKESDTWRVAASQARQTSQATSSRLRALLTGTNRQALLRIFVLMTGVWFGSNVASVLLPAIILKSPGVSPAGGTFVWLLAELVLAAAYLGAGLLGQRFGRRPFFVACGSAMATVSAIAITLITSNVATGYAMVGIVAIIALLAGTTTFGSVPSVVCENFAIDVRATGYGLGFSLAVIIPAFYAFYQELLTSIMPRAWTPAALLVIGGVLTVIGALMMPETRDRDLSLTTAEIDASS